jgi:hypothetical protein
MRRLCLRLLTLAACAGAEPRAVVERAVQAQGGRDLLARQTAWRVELRGDVFEGEAKVPVDADLLLQTPERCKAAVRFVLDDRRCRVTHAVNGYVAHTSLLNLPSTVTADRALARAGFVHWQHYGSLLILLNDENATFAPLPEINLEGRPAVGVKARCDAWPETALYFDKETGLLVKTSCRKSLAWTGDLVLQETVLSDYRDPCSGTAEERVLRAAGLTVEAAALLGFLAPDAAALARLRALTRQLGDDQFEAREKAAAALVAAGPAALVALEEAANPDDLEAARRARLCVEEIRARHGTATTLAAVRWLAVKAPPGAAETLLALATRDEEAVAAEAKDALAALAARPGGPPAALLRALDDTQPKRRAAAAAVLGKDGGAWLARPDRRLYLTGLRQPHRLTLSFDGRKEAALEVRAVEYRNRIADRELDPPPRGRP